MPRRNGDSRVSVAPEVNRRRVVVTGLGEFKSIKIDPEAVDADDVETLEDLVLAAIHNGSEAVRELTEQKMGPATGGLGGLSLPGF